MKNIEMKHLSEHTHVLNIYSHVSNQLCYILQVHTHTHTHTHTYIHKYVHIMHTYIHTCIQALCKFIRNHQLNECIRDIQPVMTNILSKDGKLSLVLSSTEMYVCVCVCVCVRIRMYVCLYVYQCHWHKPNKIVETPRTESEVATVYCIR